MLLLQTLAYKTQHGKHGKPIILERKSQEMAKLNTCYQNRENLSQGNKNSIFSVGKWMFTKTEKSAPYWHPRSQCKPGAPPLAKLLLAQGLILSNFPMPVQLCPRGGHCTLWCRVSQRPPQGMGLHCGCTAAGKLNRIGPSGSYCSMPVVSGTVIWSSSLSSI